MTPQVPQGQAHTRLQAASQAVKARSQAVKARSQAVKARLVAMDVSDTLHIDAVAQAQIAMVDIVLLEGMEAHVKHALNEAHAEVERVTMDLTERTVERDAAQEWRLYNADAAERIMERAKAAESERDEARAALAAAERTLAEIEKRSTRADDGLACHPLNEREHRMSDEKQNHAWYCRWLPWPPLLCCWVDRVTVCATCLRCGRELSS